MPFAVARLQLKRYIEFNRIDIFHSRKNKDNFLFKHLKKPSKSVKQILFSLKRHYGRNVFGLLTAHDDLNFYKNRLNFKENNFGKCRFCSFPNKDISHLIFTCNNNPFILNLYASLCKISDTF